MYWSWTCCHNNLGKPKSQLSCIFITRQASNDAYMTSFHCWVLQENEPCLRPKYVRCIFCLVYELRMSAWHCCALAWGPFTAFLIPLTQSLYWGWHVKTFCDLAGQRQLWVLWLLKGSAMARLVWLGYENFLSARYAVIDLATRVLSCSPYCWVIKRWVMWVFYNHLIESHCKIKSRNTVVSYEHKHKNYEAALEVQPKY